jgi:hypothetical protein
VGRGVLRARFHVDADYRFAQRAQGFEAGVTEFETELVLALCLKRVVALITGGVRRALALFSYMDFWMDFERDHKIPQGMEEHEACQIGTKDKIEGKRLRSGEGVRLRE